MGASFLNVSGRKDWAPVLEWCGGTGLGIDWESLGGKTVEGFTVGGGALGLLLWAIELCGEGPETPRVSRRVG